MSTEQSYQNEVTNEEHRQHLEQVAAFYGKGSQYAKTVEELGELLIEISKVQLGAAPGCTLVSEIADVYNMLDQICILEDIEDAVDDERDRKMAAAFASIP